MTVRIDANTTIGGTSNSGNTLNCFTVSYTGASTTGIQGCVGLDGTGNISVNGLTKAIITNTTKGGCAANGVCTI